MLLAFFSGGAVTTTPPEEGRATRPELNLFQNLDFFFFLLIVVLFRAGCDSSSRANTRWKEPRLRTCTSITRDNGAGSASVHPIGTFCLPTVCLHVPILVVVSVDSSSSASRTCRVLVHAPTEEAATNAASALFAARHGVYCMPHHL